jgi:tRNA-dihydrouridine synthase
MWGGIEYYYTPFVRIEKGDFRHKDINDIATENNSNTPVVPQMLPHDGDELARITELFLSKGYNKADINMGCPFPPVALHGRGSGLLPHKELIKGLMQATTQYPEMQFSVKMRLGWEDKNEWREVMDILNTTTLTHITLHPRIGRQQYKGSVDMEEFDNFYNLCIHPIIYNGDLNSTADVKNIALKYPKLKGVMLGRGLIARPYLSTLLKSEVKLGANEIIARTEKFHNALYKELEASSQGNTQLMQRAHALWEYFLPHAPHKHRKAVLKSSSARQYTNAVAQLFDAWNGMSEESNTL